jgi:hypothetical protein
MSIEAMKQALDALKKAKDDADNYLVTSQQDVRIMGHIVSLIEAELAKPEQEPVAWMVRDQVDGCRYPSALKNPAGSINGESQPLYTAPPQAEKQEPVDIHCPSCLHPFAVVPVAEREWVGLNWDDVPDVFVGDIAFMQGAKWALAKLKEKNT